ncbi:MAG: hypothetical protein AB7K24_13445 [Gemmataceae bacterium]
MRTCVAILTLLLAASALPGQDALILKDRLDAGRKLGFDENAERAVKDAFTWLLPLQKEKGDFPSAKDREVAGAALAVLALHGIGQSRETAKGPELNKALKFLVSKQSAAGRFHSQDYWQHTMATIALCEMVAKEDARYGVLGIGAASSALEKASELGFQVVLNSQNPDGGWSSGVVEKSDLHTTAWQLLALRSGQAVGYRIPAQRFEDVRRYLDRLAHEDGLRYSMRPGEEPSDFATVLGLATRATLGDPLPEAAVAALLKKGVPENLDSETMLFTSIALKRSKNVEAYKKWYEQMTRVLPVAQQQNGSWAALKGDPHQDELTVSMLRLLALESCLSPPKGKRGLSLFRVE